MMAIRRSVRRLQRMPLIGPRLWRLRPLVHFGFRLLALRHRAYQAMRAIDYRRLWVCVEAYRPLLGEKPSRLGHRQRLQRRLLRIFLALPDYPYRLALAKLDREDGDLSSVRVRGRAGILMMIGTLGPGGSERQLVLTLKALKERGYGPLTLACVNLLGSVERFFLPEIEAAGIAVGRIGPDSSDSGVFAAGRVAGLLPKTLADVRDYAATIAAANPAIVQLWLDEVNVKGGIAAVICGVPRVILCLRSLPPFNFSFHQPYMREAYRWLARQPAVLLVSNSDAGGRAYETWLGLAKGTIRCISNGFAFDESRLRSYRAGRDAYRARMGIVREVPLVGGVFRMTEEKRPFLWIEIAAAVRHALPRTRFLLVGDGPLRKDLERRASTVDLAGSVQFVGHERDALRAIAAMDVFLLTSRIEGLPNVLVEAQALGVPVVTTPAGGAPETILDGITGIVLKNGDAAQAAAAIVALLENREWREQVGRQATAFVKSAFSIERTVDAMTALYGS